MNLDHTDLDNALKRTSVIGAAGKMGSGISLLLLKEIARLHKQTGEEYQLTLIDPGGEKALEGLKGYLTAQLSKENEKHAEEALQLVRFTTGLEDAASSSLVFEAVPEEVELKQQLFTTLKRICEPSTYYFTNTSSIPISLLNEKVGLDDKIIGYHFYNPPAVQKLLEIITTPTTEKALVTLSKELGERLGKCIVLSNDIAGFIGNGHFMRDLLFACQQVHDLCSGQEGKQYTLPQALYIINRVTQEFMVRPMGIFQLADYVGIEVCQKILRVMSTYIDGVLLEDQIINQMVEIGQLGGQNPDGSQKDGFFRYEKGKPAAVYDLEKKGYLALDAGEWTALCDRELGSPPEGCLPWKVLIKDPEKSSKLKHYFGQLFDRGGGTLGSALAQQYLLRTKEIASNLVSDGVAECVDDVNAVLKKGFYHLYGPVNSYY